jgi:lipopolysaccharide biosynthesis glycosyltransferase
MDDLAKKRINVCFTIEESYAQYVCVAISSMLKNNPSVFFSIHIFSLGLKKGIKTSIKSVLIDHTNHDLSFIDADVKLVQDFKVTLHASPVNYLRLFIASMLPQLDKILYLDCDIIVRSSLLELYEIDVSTVLFAAVPHKDLERSAVLDIGDDDYFNSGVLLINLIKWRQLNATDKLCDFILQHPAKIHYWDQDALSAVYYDAYLKLDEKWNFITSGIEPSELEKLDVRIIHFAGMHKPWSQYSNHSLKEEYHRYLKTVEFKKTMGWWSSGMLTLMKSILNRF